MYDKNNSMTDKESNKHLLVKQLHSSSSFKLSGEDIMLNSRCFNISDQPEADHIEILKQGLREIGKRKKKLYKVYKRSKNSCV
jgi:hypothetical protein